MPHACKTCGGEASGLYCKACNERARATQVPGGERPYTGARKRATAHRNPGPRTEGLDELRLILYGAPRTKKNSASRLSHHGRPSIVPSAAWMAWRDELLKQIEPWMRLRDQPYNCAALFFRDRSVGDAHGFYQGLADALQEAGVVSDDRLLVSWNGSELLKNADNPRVELHLTPVIR